MASLKNFPFNRKINIRKTSPNEIYKYFMTKPNTKWQPIIINFASNLHALTKDGNIIVSAGQADQS